MPKVTGSLGTSISYEIRGINEVINWLRSLSIGISNDVELELVRLGTFVEEEVKQSIAGLREEPRSVRTGFLINDVQMTKPEKYTVVISAPGTEYADYLEWGTSNILARRHFGNTLDRNQDFINEKLGEAVQRTAEKFK